MNDLIRREDAIAEICKARTPDVVSHQYAELFINAVRRVPSADRPQGKWKHLKDDEWLCSNCGYVVWVASWWEHPLESGKDYCEHCGARMKGTDNE